jgi:hypothetical protein
MLAVDVEPLQARRSEFFRLAPAFKIDPLSQHRFRPALYVLRVHSSAAVSSIFSLPILPTRRERAQHDL